MPSYKENTPLALNNLIIELFGLKLYEKVYQLVNNRLFIILLGTQLLLK
jgi:hypothetical protein